MNPEKSHEGRAEYLNNSSPLESGNISSFDQYDQKELEMADTDGMFDRRVELKAVNELVRNVEIVLA